MSYWLSPIYKTEPLTIGKERFQIPEEDALKLRDFFTSLEPFFVPFLKTHILPRDEEDEDVCGIDAFPLDGDNHIVFDDNPLGLSKCGKAFINKIPSFSTIKEKRQLFYEQLSTLGKSYPIYMKHLTLWWDNHWIAVIFKD